MTDTIRTAATLLLGYLSAYGQQPTEATLAYRQSIGDIPQNLAHFDGAVSVQDCSLIGQHARLITEDLDLHVIIFDCAGDDGGLDWMLENNILAEIDYGLWRKHPEIVHRPATLVLLGWCKSEDKEKESHGQRRNTF